MTICRIEECEIRYGNFDITSRALERRADRGMSSSESLKE
jgi:hypothetical protein